MISQDMWNKTVGGLQRPNGLATPQPANAPATPASPAPTPATAQPSGLLSSVGNVPGNVPGPTATPPGAPAPAVPAPTQAPAGISTTNVPAYPNDHVRIPGYNGMLGSSSVNGVPTEIPTNLPKAPKIPFNFQTGNATLTAPTPTPTPAPTPAPAAPAPAAPAAPAAPVTPTQTPAPAHATAPPPAPEAPKVTTPYASTISDAQHIQNLRNNGLLPGGTAQPAAPAATPQPTPNPSGTAPPNTAAGGAAPPGGAPPPGGTGGTPPPNPPGGTPPGGTPGNGTPNNGGQRQWSQAAQDQFKAEAEAKAKFDQAKTDAAAKQAADEAAKAQAEAKANTYASKALGLGKKLFTTRLGPEVALLGGAIQNAYQVAHDNDKYVRDSENVFGYQPKYDGSIGDIAAHVGSTMGGALYQVANSSTNGLLDSIFHRLPAYNPANDKQATASSQQQTQTAQPGATTPTGAPANPDTLTPEQFTKIKDDKPTGVAGAAPPPYQAKTIAPGIVQDGPASFRGPNDRPFSGTTSEMSPQNKKAMANFVKNDVPAYPGTVGAAGAAGATSGKEDISSALNQLDYANAQLQQAGFNRAERGHILESLGLMKDPTQKGLLAKTGALGLEKAGLENQQLKAGMATSAAHAQMLSNYLGLNDQTDPTGARRQQLSDAILLAGGKEPKEGAHDGALKELIKTAIDPMGSQSPQELESKLQAVIKLYKTQIENRAAAAPISVDPTQNKDGTFSVVLPDGKPYNFPSAQAAKQAQLHAQQVAQQQQQPQGGI